VHEDLDQLGDMRAAHLREYRACDNVDDHALLAPIRDALAPADDNSGVSTVQVDGDLEMSEGHVQTKCPFTQTAIKRAARAHCTHYFCFVAVEEILRQRGSIKCPMPGCPQGRRFFSAADVTVCAQYQKKIDMAMKKKRQRKNVAP